MQQQRAELAERQLAENEAKIEKLVAAVKAQQAIWQSVRRAIPRQFFAVDISVV